MTPSVYWSASSIWHRTSACSSSSPTRGLRTTTTNAAGFYTNLQRAGDYAAKLGITVCFETHRGLCVNHREMLQVMADLAHPSLRLNFDTGNLLYYNEHVCGEVALTKACHLVKHVRLKDSSGRFADWKLPGTGERRRGQFSAGLPDHA